MAKTPTGLLNYSIDVDQCKEVLKYHKGLYEEIIKFKPKTNTRKAFLAAYCKFLTHKDKLDLTKYNFYAETISSESFGTKTFYKSETTFFWSEIFECIHLGYFKN